MKRLIRWGIDNSPAVNTVMVGLLLVGAISLLTMRREVFPEFDLEIILVSVPYPGASPDEVEQGICQKIEEAVRSLDGIKKQTSVAQESAGFVVIELETDCDVQKILNDVRSEVDRIPSFPELAEDPEIKQLTLREPAIRVAVIGEYVTDLEGELRLREVAEEVRNDLLQLSSVSQANIVGSREYQIDVEISEDRLREYGLTLQDVADRLRRENLELPGGNMKTQTQELLLRGKNKRLLGSEIAKIPLVTDTNGVVLTAADLGTVNDAFEDVTAVSQVNGQPGLVISVDRTQTEDLLKMVDEVKQYVDQAEVPSGFLLEPFADRSVDVRDRMQLLIKNGTQGLLLVLLVLAIFMNLRLSFWVAMGIPIAVFGAGAVLLYAGQTLNMLSMFAFLMALGIVVDDAIVIGENVHSHRQRGKPPIQAAVDGTLEVLPSVFASISTTIIAFVPLLFVSGIMGKFIAVMPVAVIAMLLISLCEAAIILPCHLAHGGGENPLMRGFKRYANLPLYIQLPVSLVLTSCAVLLALNAYPLSTPARTSPQRLLVMFEALQLTVSVALLALVNAYTLLRFADLMSKLQDLASRLLNAVVNGFYAPHLAWCVRHPAIVICSTLAIAVASLGLVASGTTPYIVFPKTDTKEIEATVVFPDGTPASVTAEATKELMASLQRIDEGRTVNIDPETSPPELVASLERLNSHKSEEHSPLVVMHRLLVGQVTAPGSLGPDTRTDGSHVGSVLAELVDASDRSLTSQEIIRLWRAETDDIVGAESIVYGSPEMGPGGTPIEFKLLSRSRDMDELEQAVEECKKKLAKYPGIVDIRDDSRPGKWEFQLTIKDKAKAMGVTLSQLANTVRGAYYGEEVMRLQRGRHEVKLMVRYPPHERRSLANFQDIRVRTEDGSEFPLTELADVKVERGYAEINRVDQLRSITITADVEESIGNASETIRDMQLSYMGGLLEKYPAVSVRWEGQQEQTNESVSSMFVGFLVAILAMFVLLTVEFRSYLQPFMILAIIPFGIVGAIWGHFFMGLPITIFTLFGLVALTGVVVNDSIVLIDFINHRIRDGMPLEEALVDAGRRRFRPVLLTSFTTIAGLSPMLTERSFQAQFLIPLAATLVFGLLVATGLVLVLIPTYYAVYRRFYNLFHREPETATLMTRPDLLDTGFVPDDEQDVVPVGSDELNIAG